MSGHRLDDSARCSCGATYMGGHPSRDDTGLDVGAYRRHVWQDWVVPWHQAHLADLDGQGTLFPVAGDSSVR
jgi:hypothetical protein